MSGRHRAAIETVEVVTAIVSLFEAWVEATEDDRVSLVEWVSFAGQAPSVVRALKGISLVPKELANLDEAEADEIIRAVSSSINKRISTEEMRLKIDKILIAFHANVDALAQWVGNNPPKGKPV